MNKKSIIFTLPVVLLLVGLASCGSSSSDEVEYIPVQTSEEGSWRFINPKGEFVGTQEWEFEPTVTIGGLFTAHDGKGFTVYKWDGDKANPIDSLKDLVAVGVYNEGLLPVTPAMQRIRVVDNKGNVKFTLEPINGQEISSCAGIVKDGMLVVTTIEGKSGVVNNKGELVVKPKYDRISDFSEGYALAADYSEDYEEGPTYYVIDKQGNSVEVKGKFGYEDDECGFLPSFKHGVVTVSGQYDEETGESVTYEINTEGVAKEKSDNGWTEYLDNGGKIESIYQDGDSEYIWKDADGKTLKNVTEGGYLSGYEKFVTLNDNNNLTVYSEDGKKIFEVEGNYYAMWPGGQFGLVLQKYEEDYSTSTYTLLDAEGKEVNSSKFYGVGINKSSNSLGMMEGEMDCGEYDITSAYVDVTAAASKMVSMITGSVTGKDNYYLGESVKNILEGESTQYMSGKVFSIPTKKDQYYLATGAGFYFTGEITATENITAPTYKEYFEVSYYDYWGRPWGYNRKKQVGVHVNSSAQVASFDIVLHTNHPSGLELREAVGRRLKKASYTLVDETDNYDIYTDNYREAIVYGSDESRGIGAVIGEKGKISLTNADKAALAAKIY